VRALSPRAARAHPPPHPSSSHTFHPQTQAEKARREKAAPSHPRQQQQQQQQQQQPSDAAYSPSSGGGGSGGLTTVIRADELYKMQKESAIETAQDLRRKQEEKEQARREREAVAEARKERIRSMEATRVANLPKSQLEQEEAEEKARRRKLAATMRDEAQDDIKKMNSILNYAITVSIRDRQLQEKKVREEQEKADERMRELQAELEVLEARKVAETAEAAKKDKLDKVRAEILTQLEYALGRKHREREQLKLDEGKRKAELTRLAEMEAKEKEEAAARRARILHETTVENERAIAAKAARRAAEEEADRKADAEALAIQQQKAAAEAEKERQKKLREEVEFKARAAVQKFYDDTESREAMLARRAFEEGERRERAKELERARKAAAVQKDMQETRERMLAEKQQRVAELVDGERAEFELAQRMQTEWLAAVKAEETNRAAQNARFLAAVRAQVDGKEAAVRAARAKEREELEEERERAAAHIDYLRTLRDRKLQEMIDLGLPAKYQAELLAYDPERAMFKKELSDRVAPRKSDAAAAAAGGDKKK
jgi:hypothetical protein